jgi:hypothetical protein
MTAHDAPGEKQKTLGKKSATKAAGGGGQSYSFVAEMEQPGRLARTLLT